jgi:hypothetical protein
MALRRIGESDVEAALRAPLYRRPSYRGREEVYGLAQDGRTVLVVIVVGSVPPMVVTVMPFSERRLRRLLAREEEL